MSTTATKLAIALTIVALTLAIVSLATIYWIVFELFGITIKFGLWRTCIEAFGLSECADTEFEGNYGTRLDAVRAFMIISVITLAVAVVTGFYLMSHPDNKHVKIAAMVCDIFATVCLLIAVAVYAQIATDVDLNGDLNWSFGLAIVAMVMSLAAAAFVGVAKPTPYPNQVGTVMVTTHMRY